MLFCLFLFIVVSTCLVVDGGEVVTLLTVTNDKPVQKPLKTSPPSSARHAPSAAPKVITTTHAPARSVSAKPLAPVSTTSDSGFFGNLFCFTSPNTVLTNYECW